MSYKAKPNKKIDIYWTKCAPALVWLFQSFLLQSIKIKIKAANTDGFSDSFTTYHVTINIIIN